MHNDKELVQTKHRQVEHLEQLFLFQNFDSALLVRHLKFQVLWS